MSLEIIEIALPKSKYDIKCPYPMEADRVVVHNTANDATAKSEISYMHGNDNQVSYHFAVDEKRAVQGLPLDRNGWHAGDGAVGVGNRKGIGVEICYSLSGGSNFTKAEQNGALLVAMILVEKGWGMAQVTKHQDYSGKYCPHRTLDISWQRFLKMVEAEYNALKGGKSTANVSTTGTYTVKSGDTLWGIANVHGSNVATLKAINGLKSDLIKPGQKLNVTKPSSTATIGVGSRVVLSNSASKYATGESIPASVKGKTYTVQQTKSDRILLKEIYSWVRKSDVTVNGKSVASAPTYKVGDRVKIKSSANKYSTGQTIPNSIKNRAYTIQQVESNKVLLKEIYSWVNKSDVTK